MRAIDPEAAPLVVADDLDPGSALRWFLLADAGACDREPLTVEMSAAVATWVGQLQRQSSGRARLRSLLPGWEAGELHDVALDCCRWARSGEWERDDDRFLREAEGALLAAQGAARRVESVLGAIPSTLVHGDLWSGNIARRHGATTLIDWGSSFWGAGSVDLVNLIVCRPAPLDEAAATRVWAAYEGGRSIGFSEEVREASLVAHTVASLAIDRGIAESIGRPPQWLRGLVPGLRGLLSGLDPWRG